MENESIRIAGEPTRKTVQTVGLPVVLSYELIDKLHLSSWFKAPDS